NSFAEKRGVCQNQVRDLYWGVRHRILPRGFLLAGVLDRSAVDPDFQFELSLRTFGCSAASVFMRV
ncbi:MAG: hypothetical protein WA739_15660, partial [Candidatus Acidiferrales bacterium]